MNQPSGDVIQIGAVAGDPFEGKIHEKFNQYVRINEPLSPKIIRLTKITDQLLYTKGDTLENAVKKLKKFMEKNEVFDCPVSWGLDGEYLKDRLYQKRINIELFSDDVDFNVKKFYQFYCSAQGKNMKGGVKKACKTLGYPFIGQEHNALDDAYNTFVILRELVKFLPKD